MLQISGGYYHSAALDAAGNIYTWGKWNRMPIDD